MQPGSKYQFPFTPPRYVEETAEPYILFYAWHIQQEKKKRIRVRVDGATKEERARNGARLVREFSKKLTDGWHISEPEGFQPPVKVAPTSNDLDPNLSVVDAFALYKKIKAKELRESTLDLYENYLNHLARFLTDTRSERFPLRKLNKTILTQFLDQLTVGGRFQNNLVGWLKSFFDFWIDDRPLLKEHPMPKVKKLRVDESDDHKPFNAEQAREIRRIILEEYKDEQLWLFCQFAYYLFLRPGNELRLLKVGDLMADQVKVISGNSKNRRVGFVDIPTSLQAEIERLGLRGYPPHYYVFTTNGKPGPVSVGKNYFYKRHVKVMKDLELFGFNYDLYSWKPTGAIVLALETKDVLRVQRHCRHSSPDQTFTYLRKHGVLFNQIRVTDFPALWE